MMEMDKYSRSYPMLGFKHHKYYPFQDDEKILAEQEIRENERAKERQREILEKRRKEAEKKRNRARNASGESKKTIRAQPSPNPSTKSTKKNVKSSGGRWAF